MCITPLSLRRSRSIVITISFKGAPGYANTYLLRRSDRLFALNAISAESIRITKLDATLPLESIKRISKFLFDNGVIAREVSGEIGQYYTYEFLVRATGRSVVDLGQNK